MRVTMGLIVLLGMLLSPTAPQQPDQGTWLRRAPMNEPRQEVGVAAVNGKIYVAGGFRANGTTADSVEVYDPEKDRWDFVARLPIPLHHPAAASVSGKLYIIGGTSPSGVSDALLEYDPETDQWMTKAPLPTARSAAAAAVIDGKIYVAGGSPAQRGSDFAVYDPETDWWAILPPMPTPRNHHAAAAINGKFYVVGGRPPTVPGLTVLEMYDPQSRKWTRLAPLPTPRSGIAGAVVRGCFYVFGGEGNPTHPLGIYDQTEVYNPLTNTWMRRAPLPTPRHGLGAAVLADRIYLPAGATRQGFGITSPLFLEVFLPPEGASCEEPTPPIALSRERR